MDRSEVLVVAHRLRRLMPRNGDVLALTDWVLGAEGRVGPGTEMVVDKVMELTAANGRLREEIEALKAAGGSGECVVCAARKAKERDRLREVMRKRRAMGGGYPRRGVS